MARDVEAKDIQPGDVLAGWGKAAAAVATGGPFVRITWQDGDSIQLRPNEHVTVQ